MKGRVDASSSFISMYLRHLNVFFQIHINGRNEIEILVNGEILEFDELSTMDLNGVIVLKYNNNTSKYSVIFNAGMSVTIENVEDILHMMLQVPPMFKGAVEDFVLIYFLVSFCCSFTVGR